MQTILLAVLFYFGAIIGSFLNVVILRLPRNETLEGRSHCVHCNHSLSTFDLVPIFSYLFLAGKCRYCRKPISPRYIIIECVTGLLFILNFIHFQPFSSTVALLMFLKGCAIVAAMVTVFVIDLEHYIILDSVIVSAALIILGLSVTIDVLQGNTGLHAASVIGLISGIILFLLFAGVYFGSNGEVMGLGDGKLGLLLGIATPGVFLIINVLAASLMGSILGILLIAVDKNNAKRKIPFGTFLAASTILALYFGPAIYHWYLFTIGAIS